MSQMKQLQIATILTLVCAVKCTLLYHNGQDSPKVIDSLSFKFYGQRFVSLNVTGAPVVELDCSHENVIKDLCEGYYKQKLSGIYAGRVVVIDPKTCTCTSATTLYLRLLEAQALAIILKSNTARLLTYSHDSNGMQTKYHSLPLLGALSKHVDEIIDAMRAGEVVILEATPNELVENVFLSMPWIVALRVLPALLALFTALAATAHFIRHYDNRRLSWILYKIFSGNLTLMEIVLIVESTSLTILTVVYALGLYDVGTVLNSKAAAFFCLNSFGSSLLTSFILGFHLHSIRRRKYLTSNAELHRPLREYSVNFRRGSAVILASTIFTELVSWTIVLITQGTGIFFADINRVFILCAITMMTYQFFICAYFFHAYFKVVFCPVGRNENQESTVRFTHWLSLSGVFMLLQNFTVFYAGKNISSIDEWKENTYIEYFGSMALYSMMRVCVSLTQVFSIRAASSGSEVTALVQKKSTSPEDGEESLDQRNIERSIQPDHEAEIYSCFELRDIQKLSAHRQKKIGESFITPSVSVVNYNSYGGDIRISSGSDSLGSNVFSFLKTTIQGGDTSWFKALQRAPLNSNYSVPRILLGKCYFDVKICVPCEGEAWICMQDTTATTSALEDLRTNLNRAERYIDDELVTLKSSVGQDPDLLTLEWNGVDERRDTATDLNSATEYKSTDSSHDLDDEKSDIHHHHGINFEGKLSGLNKISHGTPCTLATKKSERKVVSISSISSQSSSSTMYAIHKMIKKSQHQTRLSKYWWTLRVRLKAVGMFIRSGREVAVSRELSVVLHQKLPPDLLQIVLSLNRDARPTREQRQRSTDTTERRNWMILNENWYRNQGYFPLRAPDVIRHQSQRQHALN